MYTVNYCKHYDENGTVYNQTIKLKTTKEQLERFNKNVNNYGMYYFPLKVGNNFLTLSMLRLVTEFFNLNTSVLVSNPIMLNRNTVLEVTI